MDRSWMKIEDKFCDEYSHGVQEFINVATSHADEQGRIRCPCNDCSNMYFRKLPEVRRHLFLHEILEDYTRWVHHGEPFQSDIDLDSNLNNGEGDDIEHPHSDMAEMIDDVFRGTFENRNGNEKESGSLNSGEPKERETFSRLLRDAENELYPGCEKYSKLSFLVKLLHLKIKYNNSNKSFEEHLKLIKDALPEGESLPSTYYEAKKYMRDLGFGYIKIHACQNNCILFWKEYEHHEVCPTCQASRWKFDSGKRKKVPQKFLRYFPITPRLQRLYQSKMTAEDMRWHKERRVHDENLIRHLADAKQWEEFDAEHEWFARDPRNIRLGLASDGFNPFGHMSTTYSMWPVILIPYNLPPWKCMKEPFLYMSLLIPGPESPGNDIDVYLRPLVDELKDLWVNCVETYDAYSGETFKLHASLLWTINDFPAYGMLSGWSTKGKLACPICNQDACSSTLNNSQKQCYKGFRRYLDVNHVWRKSKRFDGKVENKQSPKVLSGDDILRQLTYIPKDFTFGGPPNSRKRKRSEPELNWTKKSIFFYLPYWKTLKLRHNLDVMHIEKNICENVIGTLLDIEGKTKDSLKARMDLEEMGIRSELHLQQNGKKILIPQACYTLTVAERKLFCEWLKSVKLPDGYASNLSKCVKTKEYKLSGMKSHDYHVFMQRLLPIAAHGHLRKDLYTVLSEFSQFFNQIFSKTLDKEALKKLENDIALILCKLELIYPPSFFVVMVHLAIHLPREAELGGPVQYRWMYNIERFLCTLKKFVRNKARPEGSIAEAYIDKECLTFCSMYLHGVETKFNQKERNVDGSQVATDREFSIFTQKARPISAPSYSMLSSSDFKKNQWYVLHNCDEVEEYLVKHREIIERESPINVDQRHEENFPSWFAQHVMKMHTYGIIGSEDSLFVLAIGFDRRITRYSGIVVNGVRFHTKDRDQYKRTQNSGVVVQGEHQSEDTDFYGVLTDIIELQYCHGKSVYMFMCDWWDVGNNRNGVKKDGHLVSVNFSRKWYIGDPFVQATQAQQVFYVNDIKNGGTWHIVQKTCPRNLYDVPEKHVEELIINDEPYQQLQPNEIIDIHQFDGNSVSQLDRADVPPDSIDSIDAQIALSGSNLITENEATLDDEDDTLINYNTDDSSATEEDSDNSDDDYL